MLAKKRKLTIGNFFSHSFQNCSTSQINLFTADAEGAEGSDSENSSVVELDIGSDSEINDENEDIDDSMSTPDNKGFGSETEQFFVGFPRAKTIISEITGQPKQVYPPIEPDYDSDSSTEDVSYFDWSRIKLTCH